MLHSECSWKWTQDIMRINQSKSATNGTNFQNRMVKRVKLRQHAKFDGDRSNHRQDMAIFWLFKMAVAAIMDFNFFYIFNGRRSDGSRGLNCVGMPNLVKISQNAAEICRFFRFFKMAAAAIFHLGFFKFQNSNGWTMQEGRTASLCQIWSKSVKTWPRYGDFSIFQDGGRRHLGFVKFQIFNARPAQEGRTASLCQIWSKCVKTRPRYGNLSTFQDGGRPPSWICCVCSDHPRRAFGGLYSWAKFGWNRCSTGSFDNMHVFQFQEFGLKTPIQAPKIGVFVGFYPLNGEQCQQNPKRAHSCASPRRLSHHAQKSINASDL